MGTDAVFHWMGGPSWYLDVQGVRIACDPAFAPRGTVVNFGFFSSQKLEDPVFDRAVLAGVDLWLVTHGHADHLDNEGLAQIGRNSSVIAPRTLAQKLKEFSPILLDRANPKIVMKYGTVSVSVERVPMVHGRFPLTAFFAGGGNGYYLQVRHMYSSLDLYVTGDTVQTPEVVRFFRDKNVDVVVANTGRALAGTRGPWKSLGRLTMSFADAVTLARTIEARKLIPVHFGTFSHYSENTYPEIDLPGFLCLALPGKALDLD